MYKVGDRMADYQQRICELQTLNPYEALGKTLFQQEGKGLTHVQYLYLAKNQLPENPIEALKSPAALREQPAQVFPLPVLLWEQPVQVFPLPAL